MGKMDIARGYAEKYIALALKHNKQYSKRYIATVMFEENPTLFKDVEDARYLLRTVTHCCGRGATSNLKKDTDLASRFALIPSAIQEFDPTPFTVPKAYTKALTIADIHGLFYNRGALEIAINDGVKNNCNLVIIDGDFFDHYAFSKFDKNPNIRSEFLYNEREWAVEVLRLLQDTFGYVVLKKGNHDAHRERAIMKACERSSEFSAEFQAIADFDNYIFFDGSTVKTVHESNHVKFGKLNIVHGHEYYGGGGIHVAYNRLNKAFDNVMSAHSHIAQSCGKRDINGDYYGSWTLGCMCGLSPKYNPKNNWDNGFAIVERENSGNFEVLNKRIIKNRLYSV